jgi:predicted house-cleaning noncanonical NTP pyrophosphatase (MazG superfamily)
MKTKVRKFKFAKLVRDKIVDSIETTGGKVKKRTLSSEEFVKELKAKILEEAREIPTDTDEELISELADLQEIIDNLREALNITIEDLKLVQEKKNEKAGSFKKKIYIEHVEVRADYPWIDYYLKNPDKYPEIKN